MLNRVVYRNGQNNQKARQQHQSVHSDPAEPLEVQLAGTAVGNLADGKHAHDRREAENVSDVQVHARLIQYLKPAAVKNNL